jgi:hypothetical protein
LQRIKVKFRDNIKKFIKRISSKKFKPTTIVEIVLHNSIILYFDENNKTKDTEKNRNVSVDSSLYYGANA